jgi:cell fate regulator YaaT (PSP1 superfamily)
MSCGNCGTEGAGCTPNGCKGNGNCSSGGCNKLNTFDWLAHIDYPENHKPFEIVEIRFKGSKKSFFRNVESLELFTGDMVVVESDFGHDIGQVSLSGDLVRLQLKKYGIKEDDNRIKKIYRKTTSGDLEKYEQAKSRETKTLEDARVIAMELNLSMKLSDIEFQGDNKKVTFFYTAENRVDFRELIKKYADRFKVRIEMKQVGYRQEAARLGAIGSCGRELCCSTWLTDFKQVPISSARNQNLSINMQKLSGQCGRLKCCLNYELDTYVEALTEFPKGKQIKLETENGLAYCVKTDILKRQLWFTYPKSTSWIPMELDRVNEIIALNKQGKKVESLQELAVELPGDSDVETVAPDLISDTDLKRFDKSSGNKPKKKKRRKNTGKRSNKKFNKKKPE